MKMTGFHASSLIFGIILGGSQLSCESQPDQGSAVPTRQQAVEQKAREFFTTFAQRHDWDKFCSFYREDLEFQDIILQIQLDSLWQFKRFYNWDGEAGNFRKLTPDQPHLTLETLVANEEVAVARGHLNPFYYYDKLVDTDWGMDFTIWLYFDEDLLIRKQVDWFEYDAAALDGILSHYRKNGAGALPDWLDLSEN